jgi:signal recognition particle GTPase
MMPGMKKAKAAMAQSGMDDRVLLRMDAIIGSMTPKERTRPELLNAKRKIRIANGSGTQVQDVNKLLKMHQEMGRAMKQIKKMGGLKRARQDVRQGRPRCRYAGPWRRRRRRFARPRWQACPAISMNFMKK